MSETERKESVISSLYAQKRHHEEKIVEFEKKIKAITPLLEQHKKTLRIITEKIDKITGRECIWITTHALERFRSRVGPPDATEDEMRKKVITPRLDAIIRTLGSGEYHTEDGQLKLVVSDMKIVTVYDATISKEEKNQFRKRNRRKYGTG